MTGRSPVVLESSPHFRVPSITPQSRRSNSSAPESSSPGLPSPHAFLKPAGPGLKSGSRAQEIPQGAATGFTSAAGLWKTGLLKADSEGETKGNRGVATEEDDGRTKPSIKKSTGKLAKPKKARETTPKPLDDIVGKRSPLQSFAYHDGASRRSSLGSLPAVGSPLARELDRPDAAQSTKPGISLSEYDFVAEEEVPPVAQPAQPAQAAKKPRKPKAKASESGEGTKPKKPRKDGNKIAKNAGEQPSKKPKKRLAKSESIILNSDEPDAAVESNSTTEAHRPNTGFDRFAHAEPRQGFNTVITNHESGPHSVTGISTGPGEASTYCKENGGAVTESVLPRTKKGMPVESMPTLSKEVVASDISMRAQVPPDDKDVCRDVNMAKKADESPSPVQDVPVRSLSDVLSGLGYSEIKAAISPPKRTVSGEALIKRRRIELTEPATLAPALRRAPEETTVEPAKKTKAPKRKPQTITDLATKAYRAPGEEPSEPPPVSEFFAPPQTGAVDGADREKPVDVTTVKKLRKPRAKTATSDGMTAPRKVEASTKAKKSKAKTKEADCIAKLYSPEAARIAEQGQAFLFGTSSQLAAEESPSFIRQVQTALQESERIPLLQLSGSPQRKSRTKVPSAPDGTNLSVGQGNRDLWCTAARDEEGDTLEYCRLRPEERVAGAGDATALPSVAVPARAEAMVSRQTSPDPADESKRLEKTGYRMATTAHQLQGDQDREIFDLCDTSPLAPAPDAAAPDDSGLPSCPDPAASTPRPEGVARAALPPSDDSWMMLRSDSPILKADNAEHFQPQLAGNSPSRPPISISRAATSPSRLRTALGDLDANMGILAQTSPFKETGVAQRSYTTGTAADSPRRPRGRPRKDQNTATTAESSSKRRGRSPKATTSLAVGATQGASRKRSAKLTTSASQPTTSAEFVNIDEISDSESQATPSPPRRRATSSPPSMQPLDFTTVASPSLKAKAPAIVTSNLKPGDANWPAIQDKLFPQITKTVQTTPPSNDLNQPTWHEKILIYDPIVLEDFTAWLNEQDLRVEVRRLKPKPKAKGRKKEQVSEEPEYELVKEDLKPWMVQKWCEEKSICCLWKEGLRGGVRTRY